MRPVPLLAGLSLVVSLVPLAFAGEPITIGVRLTLHSSLLGEDRTLLVSTPRGYGRGDTRYPVLYLTDGEVHLVHTRGTVDFLVDNALMPDVVIVGITNTNRIRDLSPTHLDAVGYGALAAGGLDQALELFQYNVATYPASANVYDSLADALEPAGELEAALAACRRAVELAEQEGHRNLGVYRAHRDRLAELLKP